mgnify:FL=1
MKKKYLISMLQNSYSLTVLMGALVSSVDWLDRKTLLLEDGELKDDCLTVVANAKDTADTSLVFTVKNVMNVYDKVFDNGKLVEDYIYDKDGLNFVKKLREDFDKGMDSSNLTLDDKMKVYFAVTELFQAFKIRKIDSLDLTDNEFIDDYNFNVLDDYLYCARVMLETVSSIAFKRLTDYIIKDFGSDIVDISATCVDIPLSEIMDKMKYFADTVEHLISSNDVDTAKAIYLIKEQIERQIMPIPAHTLSGILSYMDEEATKDFVNSFDKPDVTDEDKDNYMKFMRDALDKNGWNTRMIIIPVSMNGDGSTCGLASLTVTYGHYNIATSKAYDYAVNSLSSTIDEDLRSSIFASYFISNLLKPVLDENAEEIVERVKKIKYSGIYDLAKSHTQSKSISLESLLEREDLPDELRAEIEKIIEDSKSGSTDIPSELMESILEYVSKAFELGKELDEDTEEKEILYN